MASIRTVKHGTDDKQRTRHHQMWTFPALLALCAGNSLVTSEFPAQRPVTRSFHVFFNLRLNKQFSNQSWGLWFETPSRSLWRHCYVNAKITSSYGQLYQLQFLFIKGYSGKFSNIKRYYHFFINQIWTKMTFDQCLFFNSIMFNYLLEELVESLIVPLLYELIICFKRAIRFSFDILLLMIYISDMTNF